MRKFTNKLEYILIDTVHVLDEFSDLLVEVYKVVK